MDLTQGEEPVITSIQVDIEPEAPTIVPYFEDSLELDSVVHSRCA